MTCPLCKGSCGSCYRKVCTWRGDRFEDALANLGEKKKPKLSDRLWHLFFKATARFWSGMASK